MKELYMKQCEEGWRSVGDRDVCPRCISDYAIQNFIKSNASAKQCSYCKRRSKRAVATPVDEVVEFMASGINSEYEDPANGVGYCTAEGGYLLPTTDSRDLLSNLDLGDSNEELFEDLCDAFSDHDWVHVDPYGDRPCDALTYNWSAFAELVKHRARFVFFRLTTNGKMAWEPEPHEILDSLHRIVKEIGLIVTIPAGAKLFRSRRHDASVKLFGAKELGTPPAEVSSHSRMSPAGIPMLYAAKDASTAEAEAISGDPTETHMTTGIFANLRRLRILDLSAIAEVPSIFDEERRHQRMPLIFLRRFAEEISKPISNAAKSYEYVPTQVMTEYFRHLFHLPTDDSPAGDPPLDGLAFKSSKRKGGINVTLFFDRDECADTAGEPGAVMVLQKATRRRASLHC